MVIFPSVDINSNVTIGCQLLLKSREEEALSAPPIRIYVQNEGPRSSCVLTSFELADNTALDYFSVLFPV